MITTRISTTTLGTELGEMVPNPDALMLIQAQEAYAWRVMPIGWEYNKLVIASPQPLDAAQISVLSLRTRWSILPRLCSEIELQIALDKYYGRPAQPRHTLRPVDPLALLRALDILPQEAVRLAIGQQLYNRQTNKEESSDSWLDWLQQQGQMTVEQVTLIRAARNNRPYLRVARFKSHPGLAVIVPALLAVRWNVVPFFADSRRLWVYTPGDAPLLNTDELSRSLGLEVRPVFVTKTQWDMAFIGLYKEENLQVATVLSADEVLLSGDWLSATQKAQAREVEKRTKQHLSSLAREKGWLTNTDWHNVEAGRYGLLPGFNPEARHTASLSRLSFTTSLGRQWGVVPLAMYSDILKVGIVQTAQSRYMPAMAAITKRQIEAHLLTKEQYRRAWSLYFERNREPIAPVPSLSDWLVAGLYATEAQMEKALEHGKDENRTLPESLIALGLVDSLDIAELLSLQSDLPWYPLETPPRQLAPEQRARLDLDRKLVALVDLGRAPDGTKSVLVALDDPFALDPLGDEQATSQLGTASIQLNTASNLGLRVQPLIVPKSALKMTADMTHAGHDRLEEYLRYLVQRHYLRPERMPIIMNGAMAGEQPLDMLLLHELPEARTVYKTLADFSGLPLVHLQPEYRQEMVVDPLGRVKRRTSTHDPVTTKPQHAALFDVKRWGAMPVWETNGRLAIAIANPLDEEARTVIEAAVAPVAVTWVVSPRDEVLAAISRKAGRKNIGTYLLEAGIITAGALDDALALSQRVGIRVGRALVLLRHTSQEELVSFLARQQRLTFYDLDPSMLEPDIARLLTEREARMYGAVPVAVDDDTVTVAMVDPLDSHAVKNVGIALGKKVSIGITTEEAFERTLDKLYQEEYTYRSTQDLFFRYPEESAFRVITPSQKIALAVLAVIIVIGLIWNAVAVLIIINALTTAFYLAFSFHRFYLVYRALSHDLEVPVSKEETDSIEDRDLPIYTILVPLYKEAAVLPKLMRSITGLDYPLAKLDVKLLMESNDMETVRAAAELDLPLNFEHLIIPHSHPKTKPKACNYGLIKAKGEFIVIYDAEDIPDSDQLKKALVAFEKSGPKVACIQAKLNYYNRNQNLLTRWFTTEYSMWFDLFLPGLDASGAPVPLGGTSNHFRRNLLEELGAWDPFNVTEDADLGIRLYKAGYKTAMIDSTTFEEANSDLANWVRQRSRWVKGYVQTWLVHSRHPIALYKEIGPKAWFGFNLTVGGTFIGFLLNPIYWALTALWFLTEWNVVQQMFPPVIYYLGAINLFVGNFAFTYMNVAGSLRREFYDMVKYALLSPIYWILMSIGAWKGFIQLLYKPFYWEKTVHGLDKGAPNMQKAKSLKDLV